MAGLTLRFLLDLLFLALLVTVPFTLLMLMVLLLA
jgi:hypothetical protein